MDFYIACVTKLRALHALGAQLPNRNVFLHHSIHITSTEILLFSQLCIDFVFYIIQQLNNIIFQILMSLKQLEIFQNLLKCNHEKDLLNIHMTQLLAPFDPVKRRSSVASTQSTAFVCPSAI